MGLLARPGAVSWQGEGSLPQDRQSLAFPLLRSATSVPGAEQATDPIPLHPGHHGHVRFRGSAVSSFVERGWPADSLEIDSNRLTIRSIFREPVVADRRDVQAVELRRQRMPFMWGTFIVVRLDGGYLPRMFLAYRSAKVRRLLVSMGWKVEDGPKVSGRDVFFSPRP